MTNDPPYEPPPWATASLTVWGKDWQIEAEEVPVEKLAQAAAYYRRLLTPPPKPRKKRQ